MPASERLFSDPPPVQLYVDTDICIAYLLESEPHHERCTRFVRHLAQARVTTLYTSSVTWIEFANVVVRERFRVGLPEEWHQRFRLAQWQHASVRRGYLEFMMEGLQRLLSQFPLVEVWLTPVIRAEALRTMATYNLRPHDAVHLASARYVDVSDVVSLDETFRQVDGLTLWNDLIHGASRV